MKFYIYAISAIIISYIAFRIFVERLFQKQINTELTNIVTSDEYKVKGRYE